MQGDKITISSCFLRLVFACISRGLRRKNTAKNKRKSTLYVADFEIVLHKMLIAATPFRGHFVTITIISINMILNMITIMIIILSMTTIIISIIMTALNMIIIMTAMLMPLTAMLMPLPLLLIVVGSCLVDIYMADNEWFIIVGRFEIDKLMHMALKITWQGDLEPSWGVAYFGFKMLLFTLFFTLA